MTEFKQIIGRGTRINEAYGKRFFTILDFRNVTHLFADPDFDGDLVWVREILQDEAFDSPDEEQQGNISIIDENGKAIVFEPLEDKRHTEPHIIDSDNIIAIAEPREKYYINGVNVVVLNECIQYLDGDSKLITASLKDYTCWTVREHYQSLDDFLTQWNNADKKQAIIQELIEQGIVLEDIKEAINKEMDVFDMICHIAFGQPPLTRAERARQVRKRPIWRTGAQGA